MSGPGDEVRPPFGDVDRNLSRRLDGVDEHECSGIVGDLDGLGDGQSRAVVPGDRAQTEEAGVGDGVFQRVAVDPTPPGREFADLDPVEVGHPLPGEVPSGVFEVGPDDDVARFPVDAGRDVVDALDCVPGERYLAGVGADEPGDSLAGALACRRGRLVHPVPTGRVVLVALLEAGDGVGHAAGARPARARVEEHAVVECGNVRAQRLCVHTRFSGAAGLKAASAGGLSQEAGERCAEKDCADGPDEVDGGVAERPCRLSGFGETDRLEGKRREGRERTTEASSDQEQDRPPDRRSEQDPEKEAAENVDGEGVDDAGLDALAEEVTSERAGHAAAADEQQGIHETHLATTWPNSTARNPRA